MEISSYEEFWEEKESVCKYCGEKLQNNLKYCSELCRKSDSVWNWDDD